MDRETSLVPVKALENLPIDTTRRLTEGDKKNLLKILEAKIYQNKTMLRGIIDEVKEQVLQRAKDKAGLPRFSDKMDELRAKKGAIQSQMEALEVRCINTTGFDPAGVMVDIIYSSDNYSPRREYYLKHREGIARAMAIKKRQDEAAEGYERYAIKFDKVQTRLVLASTYAEAMAIMDAVLGNGDSILKAKAEGPDDPIVTD